MIRRGSISGPLNFPGTSSEESLSTDCGALYAAGPRHKARVSGVIACGQAFPSVPVPRQLHGNSNHPPCCSRGTQFYSFPKKTCCRQKSSAVSRGFGNLHIKGMQRSGIWRTSARQGEHETHGTRDVETPGYYHGHARKTGKPGVLHAEGEDLLTSAYRALQPAHRAAAGAPFPLCLRRERMARA